MRSWQKQGFVMILAGVIGVSAQAGILDTCRATMRNLWVWAEREPARLSPTQQMERAWQEQTRHRDVARFQKALLASTATEIAAVRAAVDQQKASTTLPGFLTIAQLLLLYELVPGVGGLWSASQVKELLEILQEWAQSYNLGPAQLRVLLKDVRMRLELTQALDPTSELEQMGGNQFDAEEYYLREAPWGLRRLKGTDLVAAKFVSYDEVMEHFQEWVTRTSTFQEKMAMTKQLFDQAFAGGQEMSGEDYVRLVRFFTDKSFYYTFEPYGLKHDWHFFDAMTVLSWIETYSHQVALSAEQVAKIDAQIRMLFDQLKSKVYLSSMEVPRLHGILEGLGRGPKDSTF